MYKYSFSTSFYPIYLLSITKAGIGFHVWQYFYWLLLVRSRAGGSSCNSVLSRETRIRNWNFQIMTGCPWNLIMSLQQKQAWILQLPAEITDGPNPYPPCWALSDPKKVYPQELMCTNSCEARDSHTLIAVLVRQLWWRGEWEEGHIFCLLHEPHTSHRKVSSNFTFFFLAAAASFSSADRTYNPRNKFIRGQKHLQGTGEGKSVILAPVQCRIHSMDYTASQTHVLIRPKTMITWLVAMTMCEKDAVKHFLNVLVHF